MRRVAIASCIALLAVAGCGEEAPTGTTAETRARTAAEDPPPPARTIEAPPPVHVTRAAARRPRRLGGAWRQPNADHANTRRVGGPIEAASVGRLRRVWRRTIGPYVTTPIIVGGVAYVQDLNSTVYAIDASTGAIRWKTVYTERTMGPNGVAVAGGRVFAATARRAFALDIRTGRQLWSRQIAFRPGEGTDMAPGVRDGVVFVSTVPVTPEALYLPGARGILWALDAASGRTRWTWATVPAGLWGNPRANSGGGLWHTPAFDAAGNVYAAVANPGPFSQGGRAAWGRTRPGPNRWTNSAVKLDASTGRFVWGRQLLPHDLYDWDLQCPPILRRAAGREIVVVGGKMGIVWALDRRSGAPLWRRPVGTHNGHDHDNLRAMRGERLPRGRRRWRLLPGVYGGVETQMAADADTVYAPVDNQFTTLEGPVMVANQAIERATGEVVALSLADGSVRWDRPLPHAVFGGATVVNDLVFTTTYDGTLWALASGSGEPVWTAKLSSVTTATVAVAGDTLITAATGVYGDDATIVGYRLRGSASGTSAAR